MTFFLMPIKTKKTKKDPRTYPIVIEQDEQLDVSSDLIPSEDEEIQEIENLQN
jgi:hypothetical protein